MSLMTAPFSYFRAVFFYRSGSSEKQRSVYRLQRQMALAITGDKKPHDLPSVLWKSEAVVELWDPSTGDGHTGQAEGVSSYSLATFLFCFGPQWVGCCPPTQMRATPSLSSSD